MVVFQDSGSLEPPDAGQSASPPRRMQQRRQNFSQIAYFELYDIHTLVFFYPSNFIPISDFFKVSAPPLPRKAEQTASPSRHKQQRRTKPT